jgi:transcriptional regulator with GAF, ATPase, and Fis domain
MVHKFPDNNIRGLIDLAERIATRIANGMEPGAAVQRTFIESLSVEKSTPSHQPKPDYASARKNTDHESHYEDNREAITRAYMETKGNISKTVELLKERGIRTSRQWLTVYAKLWALPHKQDLK